MIQGYFYPVAVTPTREFTITMPGETTPFVGTWCEAMAAFPGKTGQVPADGSPATPTPVIFIEDNETAPVLYYGTSSEAQPLEYGGQRPTWPS